MKYLSQEGLAHFWANLLTLLNKKQDKLTAGDGIDITDGVIKVSFAKAEEGTY